VRRQLCFQFHQPGQVHLVRDDQRRYLVGRLHRVPHGLGVTRQRRVALLRRRQWLPTTNRRAGGGGVGEPENVLLEHSTVFAGTVDRRQVDSFFSGDPAHRRRG